MIKTHALACGRHSLDLANPVIMGVLNTTPDSFSDGGSCYRDNKLDVNLALQQAQRLYQAGASIIDVGGESTRPGATAVSEQEELDRVIPVVETIAAHCDVIVSVDTSTAAVMRASATAGAGLINDVRALTRPGALGAAVQTGLPVCLMHMQGTPVTMQNNPTYNNAIQEVYDFFVERIQCCEQQGLQRDKILVDPGFGFGKTLEHNLALLKNLQKLERLTCPILVGLSRKSLLGQLLNREVGERLPGSLALAMNAIARGANIVRVHDVAETADVLAVYKALEQNE